MSYIKQTIEQIACDEGFIRDMNKKMGFIPNEIEGLGEMATYLENETHIQIINEALRENNIENTEGFMGVIYGSIGSSSSQILVPRIVCQQTIIKQCHDNFKLYHEDMDVLENDINEMCEFINIQIKGNDWTIILISNNALFDKFIPLYILTELYIITKLPIAISNAIAHSFYTKNKTFLDTRPESSKRSSTLEDLFNDEIVEERLNNDKMPSSQFIVKYKDTVFAHCYDGGQSPIISETYGKIVVIPKTKEEGTFIDNGWDRTLWYPSKMGGLSIDGYMPVIDIGGGRTNEAYILNDIPTMTKNIIKEMKSVYPATPCFPVCSGKIRTAVEKHMVYTMDEDIVRLVEFEIVPIYCEYFEKSSFITTSNGRMAVYLYVI